MIKYGLISAQDWDTITKCIDHVKINNDNSINVFEIGINAGDTSRAIKEYVGDAINQYVAVDNYQDFEMTKPFEDCLFIVGDSVQQCGNLIDNFFDIGFIDANHSFHRVIADFVAYAPKIRVGGILMFHDTNPETKKFKDYQKVGSKSDERMYIQVRQALKAIGLFDNAFPEWQLLYDDWDLNNDASGITAFKKIIK